MKVKKTIADERNWKSVTSRPALKEWLKGLLRKEVNDNRKKPLTSGMWNSGKGVYTQVYINVIHV